MQVLTLLLWPTTPKIQSSSTTKCLKQQLSKLPVSACENLKASVAAELLIHKQESCPAPWANWYLKNRDGGKEQLLSAHNGRKQKTPEHPPPQNPQNKSQKAVNTEFNNAEIQSFKWEILV